MKPRSLRAGPAATRRSAIHIVLAGALAFSTLAADSLPGIEPVHDGKSVTLWVAALEPSRSISNEPKIAEAEAALHAIGPDAIPFILRYQTQNREQRLAAIRHACGVLQPEGDSKLLEALNDADAGMRETALEILPKTLLSAALDDIVQLSTDPVRAVRTAAVQALVRLAPARPETVAALVEFLHNPPPPQPAGPTDFSPEDAAVALGKIGPKAAAAIPDLTELLTDSKDELREAAAIALWKIDRNPRVVAVLAERLEEATEYRTCLRVLNVLAEIGPPAKGAVPAIVKRIEDPGVSFVPGTVDLSQLGLDTLAKIDPAAAAEARRKREK